MTALRMRALRLATVVFVVACCGWTVLQGVGIVRYRVALEIDAADSGQAGPAGPWSGKAGLASVALEDALRANTDAGDLDALKGRELLLTRLLAVRPAAPQSWASLAAVRNSLAMPRESVVGALQMSALTGPNEGDVSLQRALLGVLTWEGNPPATHARTVTDLCGLMVFDPAKPRLLLAVKTDEVRSDIRDRLMAHGCPDRIVAAIGL